MPHPPPWAYTSYSYALRFITPASYAVVLVTYPYYVGDIAPQLWLGSSSYLLGGRLCLHDTAHPLVQLPVVPSPPTHHACR